MGKGMGSWRLGLGLALIAACAEASSTRHTIRGGHAGRFRSGQASASNRSVATKLHTPGSDLVVKHVQDDNLAPPPQESIPRLVPAGPPASPGGPGEAGPRALDAVLELAGPIEARTQGSPVQERREAGIVSAVFDGLKPDAGSQVDGGGFLWEEAPEGNPLAAFQRGGRGIKVFWWNIEAGKTNAALAGDPLGTNLKRLAASDSAPDVLMLGEYRDSALGPGVLAALESRYRKTLLPYNGRSGSFGIAVFSAKDVEVEALQALPLDWAPLASSSERSRQAYRDRWLRLYSLAWNFARTYAPLRLAREGEIWNLVPVHLLQPWNVIRRRYGRLLGPFLAAYHLFFGRDNPLFNQALRLRRNLISDFGPRLDAEPLIMAGDFNLIRHTPAYYLLQRSLREVFNRAAGTFPAGSSRSGRQYPRMQIDHAFVSRGASVEAAEALHLLGSDHFPIYFRVAR